MTWGFGASGALGHGSTLSYTEPRILETMASYVVTNIEAGAYHNAVVTMEGTVFTWGRGDVN
jgi:alpha-tubulin suppressor-like RCC1 family protein